MKRKNITIEDVAAQANVSRQTVSRVLTGRDRVAEETRARVMAVIERRIGGDDDDDKGGEEKRKGPFDPDDPDMTGVTLKWKDGKLNYCISILGHEVCKDSSDKLRDYLRRRSA